MKKVKFLGHRLRQSQGQFAHLLEVADELVDEPLALDLADHVAVVVVPKAKMSNLSFVRSAAHLKEYFLQASLFAAI